MKGKKILSLVLAIMLVLGALPAGLSFTAFADEIVFFEVGSVEDWNSLADYIDSHSDHENVYYDIKLTADIGPVTRMCNGRFGGSFDGQGHTITADISVGGQAALFLPQGSFNVRNLTVAGTIAGTDEHTAALIGVGYNNTISNVRVTANVISSADKIGGLIGSTYFYTGIVIENCEFAGTILKTGDPAHMIGGFCGYFNDSTPSCTVTNSVFSGSYTNAKNFSTLGFYDTEDNPVGSVPCTNSFTNTPNVLDGLNWYEQALTGMNIAKAAVTNGNTTTYYETFGAAKSAWGDQTELVLLDDAAVTDVLSVSGTRSLDLHGHGLLQTADKSVLNVTDSSLTIRDSVPTTLHRITLNENSRGVAVAVGHAAAETDTLKNVTGGFITGGCAEKGGGLFVKNATLTMAGGTVIGNVADSAGGGVDAAVRSTLNLQGVSVLNNAAGFNGFYGIGGGVIVGNGAALNMTGGTISGNIANASQKHSGEGGGVSAVSGSNTAVNLQGNCFIQNNRSGEAANNLYLENNVSIRFKGALSADSRIGITMQTPGVFTEALGSSASTDSFTSDDPAYRVLRNSSDQAYLCDVSSAPYQAGDTLQYGTYPQSEVTDAATLTALNAKLKDSGWISYGYYIGTGGSNGEMAPDDFMRYQDVVLDGAKYRAVTFDRYRPYLTTSSSSADNSYQHENGYDPGNTYWFRFEPVTWKVLDPDSGLVLCCSAIDSQAYHNYFLEEYSDDYDHYFYWGDAEQKNRANDYAHSSIRAWLNEDFINTAFSAAQQENIKVSELDNSLDYSSTSTYVYANTSDKIFLPSVSDVTAYGFDSDRDALDEARRRAPSDYAKCQGLIKDSGKTAFWWLRTPQSSAGNTVCIINVFGGGSSFTLTTSTAIGVVPALRMQELQDDPTGAPLKVAMEIANYDELKAFASAVNGGQTGLKAILKSDIAATDKEWTPIGNELKPYVGIFDGDGHTITGLSNEDVANAPINAGLFGWLGENAKVKNVRLTGVDLKATYYLGAVAGDAKGAEITNCRNTGEINCTASQVGGIIGSIRGAIVSNCCNTGDITSTANNAYVGGIAGFLCGDQSAAGITNCYNTGTVTGKGRYSNVGGIAGYANDRNCTVEIANCYNTGAVTATGTSSRAGGIAASSCVFDGGTVEVINCYSAGAVTADQNVGGVIGLKYNSVVRNCYYDSDVCGLSSAIGKIDDTDDVKGLHTDEMTGASALTQMPFSDPSAWLVKGTTNLYEFYPHLKGFDFNADGSQKEASAIDAADWPAKIAHSHTYGEPVWSWEKDHSKATATFTCSGCGDEQTVTDEEIDVTVVSAADCTNDRVVTYTAGVTFAGAPYENAVKNVTLPDTATGHTYGDTGDDRFTCTVCGAEDAARKAAAALADAKAAAKTELENYKDPADYRADEQTDLAAAIADGEAAIDAAADIDAVNTALTAAKAVIDAIKTDAQLAAEELAADTAAADAVEAKIDAIGEVAYTDESKAKIDDARAAYDDLTDKQKALVDNKDTLEKAEDAYQLLEDKDNFEQYKDELKQAAEDMRKDDDSEESKKLIDDTVAAIEAMEYDESKPLDDNKKAVEDTANLPQLEEKLTDQRAADAVEKKINDIGTVALTDESKQKIDDAREAYNNLTDAQKALVGNKDTLETAEDAYQLLEDKDNFEKYKDELKQAAEDKRKDDDSAESKKLIDDTIAAIDAMEYDENKSLDENKQAIDDASALDELTEQLEEHRAIYYAVFLAEGVEIDRVPYTIDTQSITEPAVPDKPYYDGAWEPYSLVSGGVTVNAVYTYSGTPTVKPIGFGSEVTLEYKQSMDFDFLADELPEGATVHVFYNGEAQGEGTSITVEEPTDDYTIEARAFDANGNEIASSGVIKVTVKHRLIDKIKAFFHKLFWGLFRVLLDLIDTVC